MDFPNVGKFSLRQIEVLHAVLEHGSVVAAARALNVSQPSVSLMIRQLEDRIELPLFVRTGGRIVPTTYAEALHDLTRDLDTVLARIRSFAPSLQKGHGLHLVIGVVPALSFEILPLTVASMRKRFPGVRFDIRLVASNSVPELLKTREIDCALHFCLPDKAGIIDVRTIGSCPLLGLVSRADLGIIKPGLAGLAARPMISVSQSGPVGDLVAEALIAEGLDPQIVATVDSYHVAASLVASGIGGAVVDFFSAKAVDDHALAKIVLPEIPEIEIAASRSTPCLKPDLVDAFIQASTVAVSRTRLP